MAETAAFDSREEPSPDSSSAAEPSSRAWHPVTRVAFRFAIVWFVLTNLPFPFRTLPWLGQYTAYYSWAWGRFVRWAASVAHVSGAVSSQVSSSGDKLFDWLLATTFLIVAAMAALVWSIADRRRIDYRTLHERLRVYLRFALASILLGYGLVKIFPAQFPFPGDDVLLEPYGRSSPMRLLWTFMGYSRAYSAFGGIAEILPALLLFSRRTAMLGALAAAAVLTNVVMLNLSYDVPVKLYSAQLLATALFLLLPDVRRLADVFLLHRPTSPVPMPPPPRTRWGRVGRPAMALALVLSASAEGIRTLQNFSADAPRPALYGIYDVDTFERNGEALPPLLTDTLRWRRLVVNRWGTVTLLHMDESQEWFQLADDADKHVVTLISHREKGTSFQLSYARGADASLSLEGTWRGDRIRVSTRRVDDASFLLVSRQFHWVSEFPYNR